jgi:hypothetical protein
MTLTHPIHLLVRAIVNDTSIAKYQDFIAFRHIFTMSYKIITTVDSHDSGYTTDTLL